VHAVFGAPDIGAAYRPHVTELPKMDEIVCKLLNCTH
jgi:hypothetical protein